jgi:DNA-binding MarR family transcriptional regulator
LPQLTPCGSVAQIGPTDRFVNLVNELTGSAVSADPLAVANQLRPVLLQLARELRREVHPLGVTGGQVALLVSIRRAPGVGVRDLAAREGVSPAAMSRHVARLARAGLVRRTAGAGGDRRRVGIELTDEAERVLRLVRSRRTAWLVARLKTLEPESLAAIADAVEPLQALIEARP